jgi:hypothetical protein
MVNIWCLQEALAFFFDRPTKFRVGGFIQAPTAIQRTTISWLLTGLLKFANNPTASLLMLALKGTNAQGSVIERRPAQAS